MTAQGYRQEAIGGGMPSWYRLVIWQPVEGGCDNGRRRFAMATSDGLTELLAVAHKQVRVVNWASWQVPPGDARLAEYVSADQPPLTNGLLQGYLSTCSWIWQRPIVPDEQAGSTRRTVHPGGGTVRAMIPKDTTAEAWARQIDDLRAMGPQARLRLAATASDEVRVLARAGIRRRHPDWSDLQIVEAFEAMMLGDDLASASRADRLKIAR
jgi:hypothetical protein